MKIQLSIAIFLTILGCNTSTKNADSVMKGTPFYVGTYTGPESEGIYKYLLNDDGTLELAGLAAKVPNPSFLVKTDDGKYLLSVSEVSSEDKTGFVNSYRIEKDTLLPLSQSTSGGAHPCFVAVNKSGSVLIANYTGGNMALLKLDKQGKLSDLLDLVQHEGNDITERQKGPHAHSAWFDPVNDNIISVDLGTNELWISTIDPKLNKLVAADPPTLEMNPGAGPRHLAFHPNGKWIYVVNELDCTVSLITRTKDNSYQLDASVSTLPKGFTDKSTCADIHVSSDGKFVYASNRGHNSIAVFSVNQADGNLKAIGYESTRGKTPRNFSLSPDEKFVLVANQNSNNIVSFTRDIETGLLEFVDEVQAPKPVCIRF